MVPPTPHHAPSHAWCSTFWLSGCAFSQYHCSIVMSPSINCNCFLRMAAWDASPLRTCGSAMCAECHWLAQDPPPQPGELTTCILHKIPDPPWPQESTSTCVPGLVQHLQGGHAISRHVRHVQDGSPPSVQKPLPEQIHLHMHSCTHKRRLKGWQCCVLWSKDRLDARWMRAERPA